MLGHCWVPGGNSQRCIWQPGSFPTAKLWISSHWIKSRKSICSRWERAEHKNQSNAKLDQIRDVTELCPQHWPIHRCLGGSVSSICKEAKNCRSLMIEIRAHIKFGCSFVQKAHTEAHKMNPTIKTEVLLSPTTSRPGPCWNLSSKPYRR